MPSWEKMSGQRDIIRVSPFSAVSERWAYNRRANQRVLRNRCTARAARDKTQDTRRRTVLIQGLLFNLLGFTESPFFFGNSTAFAAPITADLRLVVRLSLSTSHTATALIFRCVFSCPDRTKTTVPQRPVQRLTPQSLNILFVWGAADRPDIHNARPNARRAEHFARTERQSTDSDLPDRVAQGLRFGSLLPSEF